MQIHIEQANEREIDALSSIALESFLKHVAPNYRPEGIEEFTRHVSPERIKKRMRSGNTFYLAKTGKQIVGIAETREPSHLAMFFIQTSMQRQGIGRKIFERILSDFQKQKRESPFITVNASPNSTFIYQKLGFEPTDEMREVNGMKFVPMQHSIK